LAHKKSHPGYPHVLKLVTLDDLEPRNDRMRYFTEFRNSVPWEDN